MGYLTDLHGQHPVVLGHERLQRGHVVIAQVHLRRIYKCYLLLPQGSLGGTVQIWGKELGFGKGDPGSLKPYTQPRAVTPSCKKQGTHTLFVCEERSQSRAEGLHGPGQANFPPKLFWPKESKRAQ